MAANVQNMQTNLYRQITQWRQTQDLHMPMVSAHRGTEGGNAHDEAEYVPLYLPSDTPYLASADLQLLEVRLRKAQADDALATIRRLRRAVTGVSAFKRKNINGMGNRSNSRMQSLFTKFQSKIDLAKQRYRRSRAALISLEPDEGWATTLKELKDEDIRGPNCEDDEERMIKKSRLGEGRYQPSWIWLTPGANLNSDGTDIGEFGDSIRVEWAKAKARVARWDEELRLICEEMRRVLCFLEWKSKWWKTQRGLRHDTTRMVASGLDSYASKQAAIYARLALIFAAQWVPRLTKLEHTPSWVSEYSASMLNDLTTSQSAHQVLDASNMDDDENDERDDSKSRANLGGTSQVDVDDLYNEEDILSLAAHNDVDTDTCSDVE